MAAIKNLVKFYLQTQKMGNVSHLIFFVRLVVSNLPIIVDTLYNCGTIMYNIQFFCMFETI